MRVLVDELEAEVLSDNSYTLEIDYQDVVDYYNEEDNR